MTTEPTSIVSDRSEENRDHVPIAAGPSLAMSVAKLASGRVFGAAVALVMMPIIYRLYDDRSVGILGFMASVVMFIDPCTTGFCYLRAMPLTASVVERRALFVLATLLGIVAAIASTVLVVFGSGTIAAAFGKPELGKYLLLLPLFCLAATFRWVGDFSLSSHKKFGTVAIRETVSVTASKVTQIAMGLWPCRNNPIGLLVGSLVGTCCATATFARTSYRLVFWQTTPFRFSQVVEVARRFRNFPRFRFWTEMANTATNQSPVFVLTYFFPLEVLGDFSLARLVIAQPLRLFAMASRDVFYVEAAECASRGQKASDAAVQLLRATSVLMAFPVVTLLFLGPPLFEIIFGAPWREAGVYVQILTPWACASAIGWPLISTFDTNNRLAEGLVANLILLVAQTSGLVLGSVCGGPKTALTNFVIATVLVWMGILVRVLHLAGVGRRVALRIMLLPYVEATLLLLPAGLLYWVMGSTAGALVACGAAGVIQLLILHRRYPRISKRIKRRLNRRKDSDTSNHVEVA